MSLVRSTVLIVGLLVSVVSGATSPPPFEDARVEATSLFEPYRAALKSYYDATDDAKADGRSVELEDPTPAFIDQVMAKADAYRGHDAAIVFLALVVQNADDDAQRTDAVDRALADHVTSPNLVPMVAAIAWTGRRLGPDKHLATLNAIIEENRSFEVQAEARLARAQRVYAKHPMIRYPNAEERKSADNDLRRALALAGRIEGDLVGRAPIAPDRDLELRIRGMQFESVNLRIGAEVPDIVGEDLDGVTFRLSDYRGKVVMLDFWGDW